MNKIIFFKRKKTILFTLVCIGIVALLFNYYVNQIIVGLVNKNPNRTYNIENNSISFSIINQSITFKETEVKQLNQKNQTNTVLNASVKQIKIKGFSVYNLVFNKRIIANEIIITNPLFKIKSGDHEKKVAQNSKSINLFWKDILDNSIVKNITIVNGVVETFKNDELGFSSKGINIALYDVKLNNNKTNNPLPFLYSDFNLEIGATYAQIGPLYETRISSFMATDASLNIKNIEVKPKLNLIDFNKSLKTEKDYTEIAIDDLDFNNTSWTFVSDTVYVKATKITVNNSATTLHRNKNIKDDKTKKHLYSKIIRDLPFYITIDTFNVNNGKLTYKELQNNKQDYGEVNFKNIAIRGQHINNYNYKKDKLKTKVNFKALFLGKSRINVDYSFATKNTLDQYLLKGKLIDFHTSDLNILTKPMFNVSTHGTIKELNFRINGSVYDASARVNMVYQDLKLTYGDNKGKNKLISKIANLILKNNRDYKHAKDVDVYILRDQQKSMYNQIIKCFVESVKKTVL